MNKLSEQIEECIKNDKPSYHIEVNSEGVNNFEELFKYDEKGRVIDHKTIYVDESSVCKKYKYDKFDNIIFESEYSNLYNEELWYKNYTAYNKDNKPMYIINVTNDKESFEDIGLDGYPITDAETSDGTYQNITIFEYDNRGRVVSIRNNSKDYPNENYVYDGSSNKNYSKTTTTRNGNCELLMVSEDGKLEQEFDNYHLSFERHYDNHHNLIYEKENSNEYTYEYDENNHLIKEVNKYNLPKNKDPFIITNTYKYDENGNQIYNEISNSESDKVQWIKLKYDKDNNLIITESSVGVVDYYTYNYNNKLISVERVENEQVKQLYTARYDDKDRLVCSKNFQLGTTDYYRYED